MNEMYPAIMIEVPHQRKARVYVALSREDVVRICDAEAGDNWEWKTEDASARPLDEWLDAWGHDFSYTRVLWGRDEAVQFVENCESPQHQGVRVKCLVREACEELGWISGHDDEEDEDDREDES